MQLNIVALNYTKSYRKYKLRFYRGVLIAFNCRILRILFWPFAIKLYK